MPETLCTTDHGDHIMGKPKPATKPARTIVRVKLVSTPMTGKPAVGMYTLIHDGGSTAAIRAAMVALNAVVERPWASCAAYSRDDAAVKRFDRAIVSVDFNADRSPVE